MSEETKTKTPAKKKKGGRIVKRILLILLIVLLVGGIGLFAYTKLKSDYTITYNTYKASIGSISNSLSFSGNMQLRYSESFYPTSSAKVRQIYVAEGDEVSEGDKLIRLSNGDNYTAGIDGKVNKVNVDKDDEVGINDTLLQIADFKHMKVNIRVDEYDISSVSVGTACKVTVTANEKTFESVISSIDYISSSGGNVAYYSALIYVDLNGDEGIYPGMQVTVTIPQSEAQNVVILKADALSFHSDNSAYVNMMKEDGTMEERNVTVGVSNGNYVEIKEGLSDGDTVYVEVKEETTSSGLFGSLFGGMNINSGSGNMPSGGPGGGNMPDFSNMPSGGPSGNFGGGSSSTDSSSRSGGSSGNSGGGGFGGRN